MKIENYKLMYVLPNLFTAGSMFLAVVSVVAASKGEFEKAGWLIILASIFDALDGRVARLTRTTSKFGAEFDSLADVVSFGMAPAFLLWFAYGHHFGKFGTLAVALFVIFGAVRLARFNITDSSNEPNVFIGLPIPAAAMFVVSWVLMFQEHPGLERFAPVLLAAVFCAAALMVSNIRYPSFKKMDFGKAFFIKSLVALIVLLSFVYLYPLYMLTGIATLYLCFGPVRAAYTLITKRKRIRRTP